MILAGTEERRTRSLSVEDDGRDVTSGCPPFGRRIWSLAESYVTFSPGAFGAAAGASAATGGAFPSRRAFSLVPINVQWPACKVCDMRGSLCELGSPRDLVSLDLSSHSILGWRCREASVHQQRLGAGE